MPRKWPVTFGKGPLEKGRIRIPPGMIQEGRNSIGTSLAAYFIS